MRCPYCGHPRDRVVDTREAAEGSVVRRRRLCLYCEKRFTTYERIDEIPLMVVKKSGTREAFDRSKLMGGLLKACEKRPVAARALEEIVDAVEQRLMESNQRELSSQAVGRMLMERLLKLDKVAYLRFASVYLEFDDVREFMKVINQLFVENVRGKAVEEKTAEEESLEKA